MSPKLNFKLICTTALSFVLINSVHIPQPNHNLTNWSSSNNEALARRSGGRSSGGSFRSSPSRSSSSGTSSGSSSSNSSTRSSSPSHSNSSDSSSSSQKSAPANSNNTTTGATGGRAVGGNLEKPTSSSNSVPVNSAPSTKPPKPLQVVPHSTVNHNSSSHKKKRFLFFDIDIENDDDDNFNRNQTFTNDVNNRSSGVSPASASSPGTFWLIFVLGGIVLLLVCGGIVILVFSTIHKREKSVVSAANKERDNDIVTVSKLQVSLFDYAKGLQSELSDLIRNIDVKISDGLLELLQESALILLRNTDNWSHVLASSQSLHIDKAEGLFNQISIQERIKFTRETLTNIQGKVKENIASVSYAKQELCSYIVVTLIVGTADDKPLFKEVRSAESLKDTLEKLASVRSDYLMKVELLWSPQEEGNSLSYDELLTEYTNMIQIS